MDYSKIDQKYFLVISFTCNAVRLTERVAKVESIYVFLFLLDKRGQLNKMCCQLKIVLQNKFLTECDMIEISSMENENRWVLLRNKIRYILSSLCEVRN